MRCIVRFQASKELQDLAYELIEKARDGGKLGKGANEPPSTSNEARQNASSWPRTSPGRNPWHTCTSLRRKNIPYTMFLAKKNLERRRTWDPTSAIAIVNQAREDLVENLIKKLETEKKQG